MTNNQVVILMGVSSTGKSSVGKAVAQTLDIKFIDGDDLHPRANIQKMASGQPLNDQDRAPWLERIGDAVYSLNNKHESGIIVCSALKKQYRDQIRQGNPQVKFIHLHGEFDLILERLKQRAGHFMKANMLKSQFDTLEATSQETDVIEVEVNKSLPDVIRECVVIMQTWLTPTRLDITKVTNPQSEDADIPPTEA
ncbi:gluconokinase [Psittacicella gerlachiana]|uniref:Gluconokinase n=1 Tax=Psittacicella gerlachiana TaxID=2028574 RepID=A0A3A1YJJ5_9GAMM|nr:gluconokinase [Psittacicella gerlachiana]RIY36197.1 gluconate kinase [Psittacicella gerlachiana]